MNDNGTTPTNGAKMNGQLQYINVSAKGETLNVSDSHSAALELLLKDPGGRIEITVVADETPEPPKTKEVLITMDLTGAWEVWRATVPADATKEWIEENMWSEDIEMDIHDSGQGGSQFDSVEDYSG